MCPHLVAGGQPTLLCGIYHLPSFLPETFPVESCNPGYDNDGILGVSSLRWRFNGKHKHGALALCKKSCGMKSTLGARTAGNDSVWLFRTSILASTRASLRPLPYESYSFQRDYRHI